MARAFGERTNLVLHPSSIASYLGKPEQVAQFLRTLSLAHQRSTPTCCVDS